MKAWAASGYSTATAPGLGAPNYPEGILLAEFHQGLRDQAAGGHPNPRLEARLIAADQSKAVQRVMESNADYSLRVTGALTAPNAAAELLAALPPEVDVSQKVDLGLWDGQELLAFADLIIGWPSADVVHIGLLITDGARHGQGLGQILHDYVVSHVGRNPNIQTLRLSIVDTNADRADPFWDRLGYQPMGEAKPYDAGGVESVARIWSRPLEPGAGQAPRRTR